MPFAYVDATQVEFPPSCPHCGQPAEAGRRITAHGLLDVLVGHYVKSVNIWIPVCRAAERKRKWFGVAVVAGELTLIALGGVLAVALSVAGHNTVSAVVVLAAVSLALPIRGDLDAMFSDWYVVGVCAWRDFGRGTRIRLSFRRDQYYSQWASMNPSASTSGADGFRPPPPPPPR